MHYSEADLRMKTDSLKTVLDGDYFIHSFKGKLCSV